MSDTYASYLAFALFASSLVLQQGLRAWNCYPAENKKWLNFKQHLQELHTDLLSLPIAGQISPQANDMLPPC